MLRVALACLLLGLVVAVPAANAAGTTEILRDCADDGVLQGNYKPSELRKARKNIPTDTDEYTDCRDVLARAAAEGVAASGGGGSGGGSGGSGGSSRDFLEPWGLVVNEAFDQGVPVIATDAVGAAAGGLVQHERTGLVVPAGDAGALAAALTRLHADPALRARLGAAAREAVRGHSHAAWAAGMSAALRAAGASKTPC